MWSIQMIKYYSAIKRNGALTHATTWKNSEGMMLSKRSQSPEAHVVGVYPSEMPRVGKSIEIESRVVVARGWGVGGQWGGRDHLTGAEFPFGVDQKTF